MMMMMMMQAALWLSIKLSFRSLIAQCADLSASWWLKTLIYVACWLATASSCRPLTLLLLLLHLTLLHLEALDVVNKADIKQTGERNCSTWLKQPFRINYRSKPLINLSSGDSIGFGRGQRRPIHSKGPADWLVCKNCIDERAFFRIGSPKNGTILISIFSLHCIQLQNANNGELITRILLSANCSKRKVLQFCNVNPRQYT